MIDNFEEETSPLTDDEMKIVPLFIDNLPKYQKGNCIATNILVTKFNEFTERNKDSKLPKLTPTRVRKIVGYLRRTSVLPVLASNKGYYVSEDKADIAKEAASLRQRADAIIQAAIGLEKFLV